LNRAFYVLQAVVRLVVDRGVGRLLLHAGLEAAALNHEAIDDAMKYGVVIVAFLHIVKKVLDGFRRFFRVQFELDDAVVCL